MSLVVVNGTEVLLLQYLLNRVLKLRLYSNNVVPAVGDTVASYTEVSGGGYVAITLAYATWSITPGAPTVALYGLAQDFTFTGPTDAPGTVYGYYITDAAGTTLYYAERFAPGVVPFSPVLNSLIRITPRLEAA